MIKVSYHTPYLLFSHIIGALVKSEEGGVAFMMACWMLMFTPPGLQVASNAFLPFK